MPPPWMHLDAVEVHAPRLLAILGAVTAPKIHSLESIRPDLKVRWITIFGTLCYT